MRICIRVLSFIIFVSTLSLIAGCDEPKIIEDTAGQKYVLGTDNSPWMIVNFWASWCKYCKAEVPELNRFKLHLPRRTVLVAANYDGLTGNALKVAVKSMGIEFPSLTAKSIESLHLAHIDGLPTTIIIAPSGDVVKRLFGPQTQTKLAKTMALLTTPA